jgi:hypothetical protein
MSWRAKYNVKHQSSSSGDMKVLHENVVRITSCIANILKRRAGAAHILETVMHACRKSDFLTATITHVVSANLAVSTHHTTFFKIESCAVLRKRCGTAYLPVSHNKSLTTGIAAEEEEEEETPRVTLQQH